MSLLLVHLNHIKVQVSFFFSHHVSCLTGILLFTYVFYIFTFIIKPPSQLQFSLTQVSLKPEGAKKKKK